MGNISCIAVGDPGRLTIKVWWSHIVSKMDDDVGDDDDDMTPTTPRDSNDAVYIGLRILLFFFLWLGDADGDDDFVTGIWVVVLVVVYTVVLKMNDIKFINSYVTISRVASGVTSRIPNPVPPVVMIQSTLIWLPLSHIVRILACIAAISSGTIIFIMNCKSDGIPGTDRIVSAIIGPLWSG